MEQQVFWRITRERELRQHQQIGGQLTAGAFGRRHDAPRIARDVAHEHVQLPEGDSQFVRGGHLRGGATWRAAPWRACASRPASSRRPCAPGGLGFAFAFRLDDQHVRAAELLERLGAPLRQLFGHRLAEIGRRLHGACAGLVERAELVGRRALAARDDGAGMAHALARRRRDAGDVGHHGLGHVPADEIGRGFLIGAADLAHHDDAFGLRIAFEQLQHVDEVHAAHRIAADADAGALAEPGVGGLEHGLVGERARTRHDADAAFLVDEARHDADLAFARRDDARAVGTDQARPRSGERCLHSHHVVDRNALGDAHHQLDAGIGRLEDGVGGERRRHIDDAGGGAGLSDGIGHGVEHRQVQVFFTATAGRDAADHLRAVLDALFGMERALLAGEALADHAGVLVDENAHCFLLACGERDDLAGRVGEIGGGGDGERAVREHFARHVRVRSLQPHHHGHGSHPPA